MKRSKIISTAGLNLYDASRLRSYCQLMQSSLIDKWLFADEYTECDVCFIMSDYLSKMNASTYGKAQSIVTVLTPNDPVPANGYYISLPLTANKIRSLLNQLSNSLAFMNKKTKSDEVKPDTDRKPSNKMNPVFKVLWNALQKRRKAKSIKLEKKKKLKFLANLNQKINPESTPACQVVLFGSPGSGKTTAIQSASMNSALSTEVVATDCVADLKPSTTIGIDYAQVTLQGGKLLKLIGTPGQLKFNFLWSITCKNADAFIILLDLSRQDPLSYLSFYMKFLKIELDITPKVFVGLTHCELCDYSKKRLIDKIKNRYSTIKSIAEIDARKTSDVQAFLNDLYPKIDDNIYSTPGSNSSAQKSSFFMSEGGGRTSKLFT
ncbi:MAG: hypothetical protein L3J52_05505 [Proteobacteria bacterium]|nr:hypothetical protein [Pseudomonadota bacterium]